MSSLRRFMILAAIAATSATASASVNSHSLDAKDIRRRMRSVDPQIGQCYRDTMGTRAGRIEVDLAIDAQGDITHVAVKAPGMPAGLTKKLGACVKRAVHGVRFPVRHSDTQAVIPYEYQLIAAPARPSPRRTATTKRSG